jgi:hypothetical protein
MPSPTGGNNGKQKNVNIMPKFTEEQAYLVEEALK